MTEQVDIAVCGARGVSRGRGVREDFGGGSAKEVRRGNAKLRVRVIETVGQQLDHRRVRCMMPIRRSERIRCEGAIPRVRIRKMVGQNRNPFVAKGAQCECVSGMIRSEAACGFGVQQSGQIRNGMAGLFVQNLKRKCRELDFVTASVFCAVDQTTPTRNEPQRQILGEPELHSLRNRLSIVGQPLHKVWQGVGAHVANGGLRLRCVGWTVPVGPLNVNRTPLAQRSSLVGGLALTREVGNRSNNGNYAKENQHPLSPLRGHAEIMEVLRGSASGHRG